MGKKKLKLMALDLGAAELLDKENQMAFGDGGSGSGSGSGGNGSGSGSGSDMPSGLLVSNSGEEVFGSFFAPVGTTSVEFTCIGNSAALPGFTCKTKGLSGTWHTKSAPGVIGTTTTINVSVDASNIYITISFATTDSNGGRAAWVAKR